MAVKRDSFEDDSKENPHIIIVEDIEEYVGESSEEEPEKKTAPQHAIKSTILLALFFAIAALLCIWLTLCNLGFTLLALLAASLFLFRKPGLNRIMGHFWNLFKIFLVCSIGFILGIFNPRLGIGLIMLYLSMQESESPQILNALLKKAAEKL
jgi:uncharacterized membrane protein